MYCTGLYPNYALGSPHSIGIRNNQACQDHGPNANQTALGGPRARLKRTLDRLSNDPKRHSLRTLTATFLSTWHVMGGQPPPYIIRALIEAHPNSLRMENKAGGIPWSWPRSITVPMVASSWAFLTCARPGASIVANNSLQHQLTACSHLFSQHPPKQLYHTSPHCVVCLESPVSIALIPCGHLCLCIDCVQTAVIIRGVCPVDRCEVESLYKVREDGDSGAMLEAS
ncbi:LOW QUALITY PROTEIN: hypothetical protein HJC23_005433 [Cyclotella cryptica]|uniref:RING-type domain-containing protein n=1 Tax=Cyclotella cryptica TaxID=29204 RepID=A0ABD3NWU8_9STRA